MLVPEAKLDGWQRVDGSSMSLGMPEDRTEPDRLAHHIVAHFDGIEKAP
jgi:hypothetical protein